ncbi:MAG: hypothetical protein HYV93_05525 [Candidatus Rokubacteria bacterium]|nr:hypothetical protein [Candidatus Rokubacteria bacterium]
MGGGGGTPWASWSSPPRCSSWGSRSTTPSSARPICSAAAPSPSCPGSCSPSPWASKRPLIKADVQKELTTWLAKYGVDLKEAALANIRFDPNYEKAIEAKQIEEQKAEQKRYELIQAQRQAEIVAAQAKGKGDAALAEAKGVADALRVKGEAEAT